MSTEDQNAPTPADDVRTSSVAFAGGLGLIVVIALVIFLEVMYYQFENHLQQVNDTDQPNVELSSLVADQQAALASYGWVDQQKKIVAIPIQRAMHIALAELRAGKFPQPAPLPAAKTPEAKSPAAKPGPVPAKAKEAAHGKT
jgi:hypothetical protein